MSEDNEYSVEDIDWGELARINIELAQKQIIDPKEKELQLEEALKTLQSIEEKDRELCKKRMTIAVSLGWRHIGFWEGWSEKNGNYFPNPPTPRDMYGVNPETGMGSFVPSFEAQILNDQIGDKIAQVIPSDTIDSVRAILNKELLPNITFGLGSNLLMPLNPKEIEAIKELMKIQDLSAIGIIRQALRLYQSSVLKVDTPSKLWSGVKENESG